MKTKQIPCPCGGFLERAQEKVIQDGIDCGTLEVEKCATCLTQYLPEETMVVVEAALKKAGLWGVERKEVKFWKTGNSVTIRIPTGIAKKLNLARLEKGYLYQEGAHRLVIET